MMGAFSTILNTSDILYANHEIMIQTLFLCAPAEDRKAIQRDLAQTHIANACWSKYKAWLQVWESSCLLKNDLRSGFDFLADPILQNIGTTSGFATAIRNILRCKKRALFFLGMPCESFSFMTSSRHRRSYAMPYGLEVYNFVVNGNLIACRCCMLIALAISRSLTWFLENPLQSTCKYLPYLRFLLAHPALCGSSISWWGPQKKFDMDFK